MQKVERKKSLSICCICVVNNLCISWQLFLMLSLKYLFVFVYVCIYVWVYMCVMCVLCCVCTTHMWEPEQDTGCLPLSSPTLFTWDRVFPWTGSKTVSVGLAGLEALGMLCLCAPLLGSRSAEPCCGCSVLHSGPCSYTPNQSPVPLSFLSQSF